MSDGMPPRRRLPLRWVTLAEAVGLAAVVISALGLYNGWNHRDAAAPPAAVATTRAVPLTLRAHRDADGARLSLVPARDAQVIQSQRIAFPSPLALSAVETTGDPRVEAGWLTEALRRADAKAPAPAGDRRLPLLVSTHYIEDGAVRDDVAIYDLGYDLEGGGLFSGKRVRLRGLSLVAHNATDGQRRIDARWALSKPAPPPAK